MSTAAERTGRVSYLLADQAVKPRRSWRQSAPEQCERAGTPLFFREARATPRPPRGRAQPSEPADPRGRHVAARAPARRDPQLHGIPASGREDPQNRGALPAVPRRPQGRRPACRKAGPRANGADRDERGGIIWHTQGSGKSLSMVFLVRKMRMIQPIKSVQDCCRHRPDRPGRTASRDRTALWRVGAAQRARRNRTANHPARGRNAS